jgi:Uncharacterized protein family UPF0004
MVPPAGFLCCCCCCLILIILTTEALLVPTALHHHHLPPPAAAAAAGQRMKSAGVSLLSETAAAVADAASAAANATATATIPALTTSTATAPAKKSSSAAWYSHRIQDSVNYDAVVTRLYLRHIVTETGEMAREVLPLLSTNQHPNVGVSADGASGTTTVPASAADPFGAVAASISACAATRTDGGTIGWIERGSNGAAAVPESILSEQVIADLYRLQPKAGDVHILHDVVHSRYHVIQVAELWLQNVLTPTGTDSNKIVVVDDDVRVGSFAGTNRAIPRRNLKGHGVLPEFPDLATYHIQTAGCQMNVADSERIEGILQHDLRLSKASHPGRADLVLFNTCSIRDHAESKLYDALGPYAASKRRGKRLALIVTGCVAQQEGEALLRRVPEIDAVLVRRSFRFGFVALWFLLFSHV